MDFKVTFPVVHFYMCPAEQLLSVMMRSTARVERTSSYEMDALKEWYLLRHFHCSMTPGRRTHLWRFSRLISAKAPHFIQEEIPRHSTQKLRALLSQWFKVIGVLTPWHPSSCCLIGYCEMHCDNNFSVPWCVTELYFLEIDFYRNIMHA